MLARHPEMMAAWLESLADDEACALEFDWKFWARPDQQLEPPGDWTTWLFLGGRGVGKTRTGAEWIRANVESGLMKRIALVGRDAADVRRVIVEGESGILAISPPWFYPKYEPSKRQISWPNGAVATIYTDAEPDALRGPQHDGAWCFSHGAMITSHQGAEMPIESIRPGAMVLTRDGPRRVIANSMRRASVGRVAFSNGRYLVGTADHPFLTPHGWTKMANLKEGDLLCAMPASIGGAKDGTATTTVITSSGGRAQSAARIATAFIGQCGALLMGAFRRATISTTRTKIADITNSEISSAFRMPSINADTFPRIQSPVSIGQKRRHLESGARTVRDQLSESRNLPDLQSADHAKQGVQIGKEPSRGNVNYVGENSKQSAASFVVSVVQSWVEGGQASVFNLQVEDTPEYFANGVLVHNCDELCKWKYAQETWDNLQFGLRLGSRPRQIVTTTPRSVPVLKDILKRSDTVITRGTTYDNRANLAPAFFREVIRRYEGTRLGRQELLGALLEDALGAMWSRAKLDQNRRSAIPIMRRIVVGVDPPISSEEKADECGIVVAGIDFDGEGYVLADLSGGGMKPDEWGKKAVDAYHHFQADMLVAEANQGGEMVSAVLRHQDPRVPVKLVHASRGKVIRAEPVAMVYEQGRVHHIGSFPELEDQMCLFTVDFDRKTQGSPDRLDACVWAFTELMPGKRTREFAIT